MALRAGQVVGGKYRVEQVLGTGTAGVVFAARTVHLREPVTLKLLAAYTDAQEEALARRVAKARLASRLAGKHVAKILDIGVTDEGQAYVVSERLEGTTLDVDLATRKRLPYAEAVRWILQACEGLAEAHVVGLIHGDLKPQNLFLADERRLQRRLGTLSGLGPGGPLDGGDGRVLKILDFGMSHPFEGNAETCPSAWLSSACYLAPEQVRAPETVDVRADVWALGVILYELVAGYLPFDAETPSGVLVSVVYDAAPLLPDVPLPLARLVHRCLDKDPSKRPMDVQELARALAPFADEHGDDIADAVERIGQQTAADLADEDDASASGSVPPVTLPALDDDADDVPLTVRVPSVPSMRISAAPLVLPGTEPDDSRRDSVRPSAPPSAWPREWQAPKSVPSRRPLRRLLRALTLGATGALAVLVALHPSEARERGQRYLERVSLAAPPLPYSPMESIPREVSAEPLVVRADAHAPPEPEVAALPALPLRVVNPDAPPPSIVFSPAARPSPLPSPRAPQPNVRPARSTPRPHSPMGRPDDSITRHF